MRRAFLRNTLNPSVLSLTECHSPRDRYQSMSPVPAAPEDSCPECGKLRVALEHAQQEIARLQAELHELRCQLNRNSSNSSVPPSADPPGARKLVVRPQAAVSRVDNRGIPGRIAADCRPNGSSSSRRMCPRSALDARPPCPKNPGRTTLSRPGIKSPNSPRWRPSSPSTQDTRTPAPVAVSSIAASSPRRSVPPSSGRARAAVMSDFSGRHHVSRRGVEEIVEAVFEVPTSLGTVIALEAETTAALAGAYPEVQQEVRQAQEEHRRDRLARSGPEAWLWAATATAAVRDPSPAEFAGLQALFGAVISGIVGSDRWSVYSKLPLELRPICWAHLKRDFPKLIDRGGPAEAIGQVGLEVVECLFADWWSFRRGALDRPGLQARVERMAHELQATLEEGCRGAIPRRRPSVSTCWHCTQRCGCSRRSRESSRRTTMPNASSAGAYCGGRTPSAATARRGAASWSGC